MRRILLTFVLILTLAAPILAHPGGTDGSGGHYDRDTGEYHYHHGHGPHQHEDLDGDGILDCPYDFEDRAGESSGHPSGSGITRYPVTTSPPASTVAESEQKEQAEVGIVGILALLCSPIIASASLAAIIDFFISRRARKEKKRESQPGHTPERMPAKAAPVRYERANGFHVPLWESVRDGMEHTRIKDKCILVEDLEYAALYLNVNLDTALKMLNEERKRNGLRPFELKGE